MKSAGKLRKLSLLHSFAPPRLCVFALNLATSILLTLSTKAVAVIAAEHNRSPVDLVLGPSDAWLATVNQTSDTVSLVRMSDGRVLDEVAVGHHPVGIALAPDGKTVLVSGHYSGDVTLLEVIGEKLAKRGTIDVGF